MSIKGQGDGLFWPSLFYVSDEEKKNPSLLIQNLIQNDYSSESLTRHMTDASGISTHNIGCSDPTLIEACERVALKFMLSDSTLAKEILSTEELDRAINSYERGQLNSKLLKRLLSVFVELISRSQSECYDGIKNIFTIPLLGELAAAKDKRVISELGELKRAIDKIVSGVKSDCYLIAERAGLDVALSEELNSLLADKIGYDFNAMRTDDLYNQADEAAILRSALLDDDAFWSLHQSFNVIKFINTVCKKNDLRHAEKLLYHIADNLMRSNNTRLVIEAKLPLPLANKSRLTDDLSLYAHRSSLSPIAKYSDPERVPKALFSYPVSEALPECIEAGKRLWNRFIESNYNENSAKVMSFIDGEISIYSSCDGITPYSLEASRLGVAPLLDSTPYSYIIKGSQRSALTLFYPAFFSRGNILARIHLTAYAVTLLTDDESARISYLGAIFARALCRIEEILGIPTLHQLDTTSREEHYSVLKSKLADYGISINDSNKKNYVIALLDRDIALMDEAREFAHLEQIGDAIYGLAVAELLFYNPDNIYYHGEIYDPYGSKLLSDFESFTRAEGQVLISKRSGLDKLYLDSGLSRKITSTLPSFEDKFLDKDELLPLGEEKHLADELEMIIGAVYLDLGIDEAMKLAKMLLRESFKKDFEREVYPTEQARKDETIGYEYWSRVLPAPLSDISAAQRMLRRALDKLALTLAIGTDTNEKRRFITSLGRRNIRDEISWELYDYLTCGLSAFIGKYEGEIRELYTNKAK